MYWIKLITEFDPVHEHPEEDQEIKPRENLEITLSDPRQPGENLELTPLIYYNCEETFRWNTWKQIQLNNDS